MDLDDHKAKEGLEIDLVEKLSGIIKRDCPYVDVTLNVLMSLLSSFMIHVYRCDHINNRQVRELIALLNRDISDSVKEIDEGRSNG